MNKEFAPYEPSLALKELGFDEPCFGYYNYNGTHFFDYKPKTDDNGVINDKSVFTNIGFYDTYEEAELACLKKLIEIVKQ